MNKPADKWRELLDTFFEHHPGERDRIANEIGVRPITLMRWTKSGTLPRLDNLRLLIAHLPQELKDHFLAAVQQEYPSILEALPPTDLTNELPLGLTVEVLSARANTPDTLRFWTISHQILQHALRRFDPENLGMAITIPRCMPPTRDGKIRSLRENLGVGTAPWKSDLGAKAIFLGAESYAGHVVMKGHAGTLPTVTDHTTLPAIKVEYEMSAAAAPICYGNRVAGCLLLASIQPNYFSSFSSFEQVQLIQHFADLLALAFEPEEFYPFDLIELGVMPPPEVQAKHFATFQQRVLQRMKEASAMQHPLSLQQAEQLVWQELEDLFLHQPLPITE